MLLKCEILVTGIDEQAFNALSREGQIEDALEYFHQRLEAPEDDCTILIYADETKLFDSTTDSLENEEDSEDYDATTDEGDLPF